MSASSSKEEVNTGLFVWSEESEGAPVEFLYNFPDSRTVYCLQVSEKVAVRMPDVEPCLPHTKLYEEDEDELRLPMMEERELNFIWDHSPIPLTESSLGDLETHGQQFNSASPKVAEGGGEETSIAAPEQVLTDRGHEGDVCA